MNMSKKHLELYENLEESTEQEKLSETAQKTKEALDKIVASKLHNDKVTTLSDASTRNGTTYVRYTSSQFANLSKSEEDVIPKQRILKIKDEKVDPMLPSAFRIRKAPPGPPKDGFTPIMHDENEAQKITKSDQKKWEIAPSVSNWKNNKGFIIGIENRLHNIQSPNQITDAELEKSTQRFTALSDALKGAERQAKQDLNARSGWRKRKEQDQISETQERLNKLAQEARESRANNFLEDKAIESKESIESDESNITSNKTNEPFDPMTEKLQRRAERRRRAEEELKRERVSTKDKVRKLAKEQGREVSDRVVLGVTEAIRKKQNESVYDTDLYLKGSGSKSQSNDDPVYDNPLFTQKAALSDVYRTRNLTGYKGLGSIGDDETDSTSVKFVKDFNKDEEPRNEAND